MSKNNENNEDKVLIENVYTILFNSLYGLISYPTLNIESAYKAIKIMCIEYSINYNDLADCFENYENKKLLKESAETLNKDPLGMIKIQATVGAICYELAASIIHHREYINQWRNSSEEEKSKFLEEADFNFKEINKTLFSVINFIKTIEYIVELQQNGTTDSTEGKENEESKDGSITMQFPDSRNTKTSSTVH